MVALPGARTNQCSAGFLFVDMQETVATLATSMDTYKMHVSDAMLVVTLPGARTSQCSAGFLFVKMQQTIASLDQQ